jgi:hypothetical protein
MNVKQKAGLNRAILAATPGQILSMLATKAERSWVRADRAEHASRSPHKRARPA